MPKGFLSAVRSEVRISKALKESSAVNLVSQRPAAGKLITLVNPHALLRSFTLTAFISLFGICFVTPALAKQQRVFTGSFGGACTPETEKHGCTPNPYPLVEPWSVAVNNVTGDVYVTDQLESRVEEFGPAGEFILMFGKEVNKTAVEEVQGVNKQKRVVAEENVCPASGHPADVCQAGVAGSTPGAFEGSALYVAVDNSSAGVSKGDVYVGGLVENENPLLKEYRNHVQKFNSSGELVAGWGTGGQLDGSTITNPLPGPFGELAGIAVDPAGNLWVYGTGSEGRIGSEGHGRVFEFNQNAELKTDWASEEAPELGIAVDAEENVYLVNLSKVTVKYGPGGERIGPVGGETEALTVAPNNDVDVGTGAEGSFSVLRYEPGCVVSPCTPAETFSSVKHLFYSRGLAVGGGAGEPLYAAEQIRREVAVFPSVTVPDVSTVKASGFTVGAATLNGSVNPSGELVTECYFEWGESEAYGQKASCEQSPGGGSAAVAVSARITGLVAGSSYHFRLVAANANDAAEPVLGQDLSFGPPVIDSGSVSNVTATSASLDAGVNPDNVDTRVRVEYGESAAYGKTAGEAEVGSGGVDQQVGFVVQGLTSGTVYHYRVVAESVLAEGVLSAVIGEDHTFTTQRASEASGEAGLLDGRRWELVSPSAKHGANLVPIRATSRLAIEAAAGGGAMAYLATVPIEAEPAGNANLTQVIAARGAGGWASRDISTPHLEPTGLSGTGGEYRVFSSDLSQGLLQPLGAFDPALSAEASEQTVYLRSDFLAGAPGGWCAGSCYRPLVTGAAGVENVPFGTVFGVDLQTGNTCPPEPLCGPQFLGGTPDLEHVVLLSRAALTEENENRGGLFEWSGGRLALVSVLPNGTAASLASGPSLGGRTESNGTSVETAIVPRHAVSTDGSRVVWSDEANGGHLYLRDMAGEATVQLDKAQGVSEPGVGEAVFQDASVDGRRVFFTDGQSLIAGAGATPGAPDLYECEIVEEEAGLGCRLRDLTPENGGEQADVQGTVIGASETGAAVYFVADGALTSVPDAHGETAVHGTCQPFHGITDASELCNLYVCENGVVRLVAVVSGDDLPDWANHKPDEPLPFMTARVSGDGGWLAFMSDRELTGYDNHDARSGQPDEEVYLYHAGGEAGAGSLVCASCDPTGARPAGREYRALEDGLVGERGVWEGDQWLAGSVPGWTSPRYQSRYLSDGGRLFFDSSDGLVAQDTNHGEDVYEYEPPAGPGAPAGDTCTSESSAYSPRSAGCIGLVSSGESAEESAFLDASENGEEVFFLTTGQLVKQDTDQSLDIYDAHVCTTSSRCPQEPGPPAPACVGDSCQGSVEPPNDQTPGSLTFDGPGNQPPTPTGPVKTAAQIRAEKLAKALKACKKEKGKVKRARCERQARGRYGPPKAKKTAKATKNKPKSTLDRRTR